MTRQAKSLLRLGTAVVSDSLRACGKAFQAMDGGLRPVAQGMRVAGPAFTVRCYPGATFAVERALELAKPGDVLVIDGGGRDDVILMGGLMSARAQKRGLAGAILDAAVRDVDDIIGLGFPVFARHVCPRCGTFAEIGEWQTTICCGRIPVNPGDWVVADNTGIVVIPPDLLDDVLTRGAEIRQKEQRIQKHLGNGKTLAESAKAASNGHG